MRQEFGTPVQATATGATAAYATVAGSAGKTIYITDIGVSSDLATGAVFQVLDGATVRWAGIIAALGQPVHHAFSTPLRLTSGATATVQITGTAQSFANLAGFILEK